MQDIKISEKKLEDFIFNHLTGDEPTFPDEVPILLEDIDYPMQEDIDVEEAKQDKASTDKPKEML